MIRSTAMFARSGDVCASFLMVRPLMVITYVYSAPYIELLALKILSTPDIWSKGPQYTAWWGVSKVSSDDALQRQLASTVRRAVA